jgi:hypothetical protein
MARMVRRAPLGLLAVALALAAGPAQAQSEHSIDGWGRVTVLGGYRWVPNWYFADQAQKAGTPITRPSLGGPDLIASFGYGATDWLELSVDLFGSFDSFAVQGFAPFTTWTYGAVLGPRLIRPNTFFRGFSPFVGVEAGATFVIVNSTSVSVGEQLLPGVTALLGFQLRIAERWAISFDARWVYARSYVPGISGVNVGGVMFSLGVSALFPPRPRSDLEAPGFGSPSNL